MRFRAFFSGFAIVIAAVAVGILMCGETRGEAAEKAAFWVYIGTYTKQASKGIYLARFDAATGKLKLEPGYAAEMAEPSFLARHPTRPLLYAVNSVNDFGGAKAGAVSAMQVEPKSGKLTLLNQKSAGGPGTTHLAVDPSGQFVLAANYNDGSAVCLPIEADGRLGDAVDFVRFEGSSVNRQRQTAPHAHCAMFDAAGKFAFVNDLGTDKTMIFRLDSATGKLTPNEQPWVAAKPGAGPRHMNFDPTGRFLYVINELDSTLDVFRYDADRGTLAPLQTVSTLPQGWNGISTTAEVQVHPSGRFVYGSNRGHDSIAAFAVDSATGKLSLIGHEPTQGKHPRHFAIDRTGRYLWVANQDSNNIVVFRIDQATGKLEPANSSISVSMPVCVLEF